MYTDNLFYFVPIHVFQHYPWATGKDVIKVKTTLSPIRQKWKDKIWNGLPDKDHRSLQDRVPFTKPDSGTKPAWQRGLYHGEFGRILQPEESGLEKASGSEMVNYGKDNGEGTSLGKMMEQDESRPDNKAIVSSATPDAYATNVADKEAPLPLSPYPGLGEMDHTMDYSSKGLSKYIPRVSGDHVAKGT